MKILCNLESKLSKKWKWN